MLPLLDHWRDPGGAYLVTMWLGGGTLTERLARGRLDLEEGSRLITQLGAALSYAHQEGIVHGAVSPGAVTLDASGNGYLVDHPACCSSHRGTSGSVGDI